MYKYTYENSGTLLVKVQDDGIGVPEQDKGIIFEQFKKGSNIKNKAQGIGLGLWIS